MVRRRIGGKYFNVRAKSTSGGRKGTIMGKWKPPKKRSIWKYFLGE